VVVLHQPTCAACAAEHPRLDARFVDVKGAERLALGIALQDQTGEGLIDAGQAGAVGSRPTRARWSPRNPG
jgi:hypothetical protein